MCPLEHGRRRVHIGVLSENNCDLKVGDAVLVKGFNRFGMPIATRRGRIASLKTYLGEDMCEVRGPMVTKTGRPTIGTCGYRSHNVTKLPFGFTHIADLALWFDLIVSDLTRRFFACELYFEEYERISNEALGVVERYYGELA